MSLLNYMRTVNYCAKVLDSCQTNEQKHIARAWVNGVVKRHAELNMPKPLSVQLRTFIKSFFGTKRGGK